MKPLLAAGYQATENTELFSEIVSDYKESVGEIYFSWSSTPSGRPGVPLTDWELQERMEYELGVLRSQGFKLDLLFNANCYGADAISEHLAAEYCGVLAYLDSRGLLPEIVTTASIFLAELLKKEFPQIERRASVNMRLDSTLALEFLGDLFDSFYIKRDLQRNLETVKLFRKWCDAHGKKMGILANSGCLRNCPAQTFHDNLVAHQKEVYKMRNLSDAMTTFCMKHYRNKENMADFLKSSWIRPEDLHHYETLVDFVKIATRQHDRPRTVIAAYANRSYSGDLAALMEPNFSSLFASQGYVENDLFPGFDALPADCAVNCTHCGKCDELWKKVFVRRNN
jgi:hypothetical protein